MNTCCFLTLISVLIVVVIACLIVLCVFAYNIHSELKLIHRITEDKL